MSNEDVKQRAKGRRSPSEGEAGFRYGGRNYIATAGQGLVAQRGAWHLVAVTSRDRPGWHNFKLYLNERARKNLFHFGVSNGKVNVNREMAVLDEHYPGVRDWAQDQANLFIEGKLKLMPERGEAIVFHQRRGWVSAQKKNAKVRSANG